MHLRLPGFLWEGGAGEVTRNGNRSLALCPYVSKKEVVGLKAEADAWQS